MALLGLHFFVRAFSLAVASGGHSSSRCAGLFTVAASLVAEHRLQTRRLSNCGSRAQLLRGMWDFPRPGLEPLSPALAGRLSTTAPPGKPSTKFLIKTSDMLGSLFLEGSGVNIIMWAGFICTENPIKQS